MKWPCIGWFEANGVDVDGFEDPERLVAVFDYFDIINSFDSQDHRRLVMLLILDAVKSSGNDRCNVEIENLKRQIEDEQLLSEYGYGGGAEMFETTKELMGEFTPTGSSILMNLMDVYNASNGDLVQVFEAGTNALLVDGTISNISKEVSHHANEMAKDGEKITARINKIAKVAGVSDTYSKFVSDVSIEVMADPMKAFDVISMHTSNITGIDQNSLRNVANNVREAIPVDEINQMSRVVTDSFE
jgi:hypothetical protein